MARYRHPQHGYHVPGYGDDIAALEAAGWVLDVPEPAPATATAPAPASVLQPRPPLPVQPWSRRRGR